MPKNRFSWQKRAKELARKEKKDEKIKRRQGKTATPRAEEEPASVGLKFPEGDDSDGAITRQFPPDMTDKEQV